MFSYPPTSSRILKNWSSGIKSGVIIVQVSGYTSPYQEQHYFLRGTRRLPSFASITCKLRNGRLFFYRCQFQLINMTLNYTAFIQFYSYVIMRNNSNFHWFLSLGTVNLCCDLMTQRQFVLLHVRCLLCSFENIERDAKSVTLKSCRLSIGIYSVLT